MKKVILSSVLTIIGSALFSQSGEKWATGGNTGSTTDFFGTTKSFPINFRTNNVQRMSLGTNGILNLNFLSGSGNRLLQTDANGNIIPFAMGNPNQVLYGNGTWGALPTPPAQLWQTNGSNIYYNNGYLGVGTSSPSYNLDVYGDARITNNLYVGGGIVISDKMQANTDIKTKAMYVDSIQMDSTKAIYGLTKVEGDLRVKFGFDVSGTAIFRGSNSILGDQSVAGNQDVQGNLIARQGLTFDGDHGLKFTPPSGNAPAKYYLGSGTYQPLSTSCPTPDPNYVWFATQGAYISRIAAGQNPSAPLVDASLTMMCAPWDGSGLIEVEGKDKNGGTNNGLLINYFCGRNTAINTGWDIPNGIDGGTVFMGAKVDMQNSLKIGWNASPTIDLNTSIDINNYANNGNGIKLNTWNNSVKFLTINNSSFSQSPFTVFADGRTRIGSGRVVAGPHTDAILTVSGKIACKEVQVFTNTTYWADYVFDENYQLMPLKELEVYYSKNHHLPNVPTTQEIEENGNNLAETDGVLLRKIEENTLYLVEVNKQLEILIKENNELKEKLKRLEEKK